MIEDDAPGTFLRALVSSSTSDPDDLILEDLRSHAAMDETYTKLIEYVTKGYPTS